MQEMSPAKLMLHCYADKIGDQWQAFCLDLSLAAQGDSFEDAKAKLDRMIVDYVYDAVVGDDREHADELLNRRAPLRYWLKFYVYVALCRLGTFRRELHRLFKEPLPLPLRPINQA